jgi:antitoxin Phd
MTWQLQDAKQRFSELVQTALDDGPQMVTRRGHEVVVVVAADEYQRLTGKTADFKDFLLAGPDLEALDIRRDQTPARKITL